MVGCTCRTEFGDMAERVGALVTIACRIRAAADAKRVQNEEKGARHGSPDKDHRRPAVPPGALGVTHITEPSTWQFSVSVGNAELGLDDRAQQSLQLIDVPTRWR